MWRTVFDRLAGRELVAKRDFDPATVRRLLHENRRAPRPRRTAAPKKYFLPGHVDVDEADAPEALPEAAE
jgi:hypothetical protein